MINLLLVILIIALLAPALGLYVVAGTLGLILKVLLVVIIVGLVLNLVNGYGPGNRWW